MEKVIEIKNLTKKYGKLVALNNFEMDVNAGEILGLLGPNGSGKSTCINTILSLLKYESGSIKIFGKEMTPNSNDIKAKIGVVFQDVAVFNELTVYENIDYFCGLYINDKNLRKQYVQEAIELVGLEDFVKFYPKKLSGGLLRRLNIACGISHRPQLIFLDEPTVAVDPQSRNHILDGIKKLSEMGATIVYSSHYMEEIEQICSRIIIMDKGQVIASGTNEQLKNSIKTGEKIIVDLNTIDEKLITAIKAMDKVIKVEITNSKVSIYFEKAQSNLSNLVKLLTEYNVEYKSMFSERPSLNDVFLELTGKELRD